MSSYHAVALCVANTYNDEAREIIAVIEESVRLEDIAKFVLTAHGKKMDRTTVLVARRVICDSWVAIAACNRPHAINLLL